MIKLFQSHKAEASGGIQWVIAGLGNPGAKYDGTRHNVGFLALDLLAQELGITVNRSRFKALCGEGTIDGQRVVLMKPQTFMNLSGESVRELSDYYKIPAENIIVIYDDISLDVGQLRIREKGSAGGHNGIKNIILHLGTEVFPRIKVGVGEKPKGWDLADYVLGRYSAEDRKIIDEAQKEAAEAVKMMVMDDVRGAMNRYNTKKKA